LSVSQKSIEDLFPKGNREAHRFTLSNALKDLRYLERMANAATVTTTMASAAKNSFAGAVAQGRRTMCRT
jgi:3-hydroxyisobutyrate dehydrogenase-like beta-hydroxyacid dehydrogenase